MSYRKQMTPGMKKCKEMYGSKKSPYKASQADQVLVRGAGDAARSERLGDDRFQSWSHGITKAGDELKRHGM